MLGADAARAADSMATSPLARAPTRLAIAEEMEDVETKKMMLRIAADYERLVKRAAERAGRLPRAN